MYSLVERHDEIGDRSASDITPVETHLPARVGIRERAALVVMLERRGVGRGLNDNWGRLWLPRSGKQGARQRRNRALPVRDEGPIRLRKPDQQHQQKNDRRQQAEQPRQTARRLRGLSKHMAQSTILRPACATDILTVSLRSVLDHIYDRISRTEEI